MKRPIIVIDQGDNVWNWHYLETENEEMIEMATKNIHIALHLGSTIAFLSCEELGLHMTNQRRVPHER